MSVFHLSKKETPFKNKRCCIKKTTNTTCVFNTIIYKTQILYIYIHYNAHYAYKCIWFFFYFQTKHPTQHNQIKCDLNKCIYIYIYIFVHGHLPLEGFELIDHVLDVLPICQSCILAFRSVRKFRVKELSRVNSVAVQFDLIPWHQCFTNKLQHIINKELLYISIFKRLLVSIYIYSACSYRLIRLPQPHHRS